MKRLLAVVLVISTICLLSTQATFAATGTVNYNVVYQQIEGFGGSGCYDAESLASHPSREEVYDLLFGDLGLDIYRIKNTYDFIASNITATAQIVAEAKERNPNIKTFLLPWSPPTYLKSTGILNEGTLKKDAYGNYIYDDYAEWWADSIDAFADVGVYPDYISIQNEPDWPYQDQVCRFDPEENTDYAGYDKAFEAVYNEVYARMGNSMPKMLAPESIGFGTSQWYINALVNRGQTDNVYGFSHHLYADGDYYHPDDMIPGMQNYRRNYGYKPLFMTEYIADGTPTFEHAVLLAQHIHNSLVYEGVTSYFHWTLFRASYSSGGMINLSSGAGYNIRDLFWFFKHYAYYTDPGWYVLDCTTNPVENLRMTAFKNPENDLLTVVILNKSTIDETLNLAINDFTYHYTKVYRSSATEHWEHQGEFSNPISLPAQSITTISFTPNTMLTCSSTVGGSIFIGGGEALYGTFMTIVAVPLPSYHFVKWTGSAVDAGKVENPNSPDTTVFMDDNYTVIANFARDASPVISGAIVDWGWVVTNTDLTDLIAVAAGGTHNLGLRIDGSLVAWGDNLFGQAEIPAGNDFVAVAAGENHSLALTADGSIVAWGDNQYHQCDVPSPNSDFIAIAAGSNHSLGLKSDGSIVAWGQNNFGQARPPEGSNFVAIAAGYWHSLALKSDGSIVGWGNNDYGQTTVPAGNPDFIGIAAGDDHCLALKSDGTIVAWGKNDLGQTDVPDGNNFIAIEAGFDHSLALTADGNVVAWGSNLDVYGCWAGQASPPDGNPDFIGIVAIAGGGYHSIALKTDGTVVGWGDNEYGQSVPPAGSDFIAVSVGGYGHTLALKADGSTVGWGNNEYGQASPPGGNDFVEIAAGGKHSLALREDGSIVAWGSNDFNQCKIPSPNSDFVAIAAGAYHSLGLKSDGSIVAWGAGGPDQSGWPHFGQTGDAPWENDFIAVAAGWFHSLALRFDGSIVAWGANWAGQADPPLGDEFVAIAAGWNHSLALKSDGSLVGWGSNNFGETDVPPGNDFTAIAAGVSFSLALKSDGSLAGWGDNYYGQANPPAGNSFVAIAAGGYHGAALVPYCKPPAPTGLSATDGDFTDHIRISWEPVPEADVYEIWRSANSDMTPASQTGECNSPPFDDFVSSGTTYYYRVRIRNSCGTSSFSASDSGYACLPAPPTGVSASKGEYTDRIHVNWNIVPRAETYELWRAVSGGSEPIVKLGDFISPPYDDYEVEPGLTYYYWVTAINSCGNSGFGLFEQGYLDNSSQSFSISGGSIFGWGQDKYGQASPPEGNDFIAVSAGLYHSLALKRDSSIVGFGSNTDGASSNPRYYGQANPPIGHDFITISAGGYHSLALKRDGSIVAWGANFYGQATPPSGNGFVTISAGYLHSLALRQDGSIAGWGDNYYGQATPPPGNDFVAVSAGNYHSLALKRDGSIIAWGSNYYGLTDAPAGNDFVAISAGLYHNLALRRNGSIVAWGRDASAQMSPPTGNDFVSIAAGMTRSLALKRNSFIAHWGYDDYGLYRQPPDYNGFITVSTFGYHYLAIATKVADQNAGPIPTLNISVAKCSVAAGRKPSSDSISISGLMDATADGILAAEFIEVTVNSKDSNGMPSPLARLFPIIDGSTFRKGKFKSTLTNGASKTSFAFNTKSQKFSFTTKKVNLSGLYCPVTFKVKIGDSLGSIDINESIVNGPKKPIPINLLMGVKNSLRVDAIKVRRGKKINTDRLSVKGGFSVKDINVNMVESSLSAKIGPQTFTIPPHSFKAGKGKFTCSKVNLYDGPDLIGVASAVFDFNKGAFTLTVKNAKIKANAGETTPFTIEFDGFDQTVYVLVP